MNEREVVRTMSAGVIRWKWNRAKTKAAVLVAADELTDTAIAAQVGTTQRSLERWKATPAFAERVAEHITTYRDAILEQGIADRVNRVAALQDRWTRMRNVIIARAQDLAHIPGGDTGLLVRTYKSIDKQVYEEFKVDTALLSEMRETEQQAAKELGQWTERRESTGSPVTIIQAFPSSPDWSPPNVTTRIIDQLPSPDHEG